MPRIGTLAHLGCTGVSDSLLERAQTMQDLRERRALLSNGTFGASQNLVSPLKSLDPPGSFP